MSEEELTGYISKHHQGKTIFEFQKQDSAAYQTALGLEIIDGLVEQGVLVRVGGGKNPQLIRMRFKKLIQEDEAARTLAYAALYSNGTGCDFEQMIMELYSGKFKDQKQLHALLEENAETIKRIVESGVTNLGAYLGRFSLGERRIFPILLEGVIEALPSERITNPLEERLARMLRVSYSPRFNDAPKRTLKELGRKASSYEGKKGDIYARLYAHYQEVMEIAGELN
jgi:hypothetical protein